MGPKSNGSSRSSYRLLRRSSFWYERLCHLRYMLREVISYVVASYSGHTKRWTRNSSQEALKNTLMRITDVDVGPNPNVPAALENNGNFLLINEIDKKILWQSFDHPTNVTLPGMKLGYDTTIGKNWTLTSWLSKEIPNSGTFTLSWEPIEEASQRLMIRRRGQPYWTSGNLNSQMFQYMFALNGPGTQSRYNLTSVYTKEAQYYFTGVETLLPKKKEAQYFSYESSNADLPMWILTPKGQIRDSGNSTVWTPEKLQSKGSQEHLGKDL